MSENLHSVLFLRVQKVNISGQMRNSSLGPKEYCIHTNTVHTVHQTSKKKYENICKGVTLCSSLHLLLK
jgi:hypothetical protein